MFSIALCLLISIALCLLILTIYIDKLLYYIPSNDCICLYFSRFNVYDFILNVHTIVERTRTIIWMRRYIRNIYYYYYHLVHVGTNNVEREGTTAIVRKYRQLVRTLNRRGLSR